MRTASVQAFTAGAPAVVLATSLVVLIALALVPLDSAAQLVVAAIFLMVMWYCRSFSGAEEPGQLPRLMIIFCGVFLMLRYMAWRAMYTLVSDDWVSTTAAVMLYAAEIYSVVLGLLGAAVNAMLLTRRRLTVADLPAGTVLPSVDVMIPSYNEEASLLEVTLRAAVIMRYPEHLLNVHLLDDGGTDQKIHDPDPAKAEAALHRRHELQALCARLGVHYHTRPRNEHAKAGNINHALPETDGDLIAIFDADHIPTIDFLDRTVPWMVLDQKVFLVQTPHFIISPDPIDRNLLSSFRRMPAENDMFYHTSRRGSTSGMRPISAGRLPCCADAISMRWEVSPARRSPRIARRRWRSTARATNRFTSRSQWFPVWRRKPLPISLCSACAGRKA
jgi:cellulose synthase (UDP-forming)